MTVEVSNESGIDVSEDELISVARFVISKMDVNPAAELSMVLVDQSAMADLHIDRRASCRERVSSPV